MPLTSHPDASLAPAGKGERPGERREQGAEWGWEALGPWVEPGAGLTNHLPTFSGPQFPPLSSGAGTYSAHVKGSPPGREEAVPTGRAGGGGPKAMGWEAGWGVGAGAGRAG